MLALAALADGAAADSSLLPHAQSLAATCYAMYERTKTGLAAEITHFAYDGLTAGTGDTWLGADAWVKPADAHALLRPETVESLFVLYRATRDPKYQEWGWRIFQAMERHCRVRHGFASLSDVTK